ncbi:AsmA family protein [Dasania marina]|uniref:AsmA family protein n=1 Tax=Dasania marina TaxID=471499 RepID=UPI00037B3014|nr:AsmA family protein [Dasania marina]
MLQVFKGVAYTILALLGVVVLVAVLLIVLLVTLVDPNDYREDISRVAHDTAGVSLTLGGDLSWRFYPIVGFGANAVELALQAGQPPLLKIDEMTLEVKVLPLLSKKIEIDGLDIKGLQANLSINEQGQNNWQIASTEQQPPAGTDTDTVATKKAKPQTFPELLIPRIRISDSSIHYQDKTTQVAYTVDLPLLELQHVNLNQPFPLLLEARVRDQQQLDVTTRLQAMVNASLATKHYGLSELQLSADIAGVFAKPVAVKIEGDLQFDQANDKTSINLSRLQLADLVAKATIEATSVSTAPAFSGQLQSETFNAKTLMAALSIPAPLTQDKHALTKVTFNAQLNGTPNTINIKPLTLKLDDSSLSGEVAVVDVAKQALQFTLHLDKLDADRYLPPASNDTPKTQQVVGPPAAGKDKNKAKPNVEAVAELLPLETLRGLNLKGKFTADEIILKQIPLQAIALDIKALDGDVRITDINAKLLQGSLAGKVTVDARSAKPLIATSIILSDIEISQLLQPFMSVQLLSGRSSVALDTRTEGNDIDTLIKQALGQIDVSMANTVLHGVNVNQIAADAIKNKLGDFASLLPDYEQKLPMALKADTEISKLLANIKVEKGHLIMPNFTADTDQGKLNASGDIDLLNQGFDYKIAVMLAALSDNKYLKGTQWPVRCKGTLATPIIQWCKPDGSAMNTLFEQAATQALRDKGAKKLSDKLGIDVADEAAAKAELRAKAKAEEERAKEKLKESLNKKFNKFLSQ